MPQHTPRGDLNNSAFSQHPRRSCDDWQTEGANSQIVVQTSIIGTSAYASEIVHYNQVGIVTLQVSSYLSDAGLSVANG